MAISIRERELMHNGIVRPLSQILTTYKEYTWAAKPSAASFGTGQAWFNDVGAMGYSDGVNWKIVHPINLLQKASGWIVPSLAAANAATYSQTGATITVTSTGHGIPASIYNGMTVYLAMASGLATAGWYTNFTYVDANTFTCASAISQSTSGTVNTNIAETVITDLTTSIPGGLMGINGSCNLSLYATYINSANAKTIRAYFGGSIYLNYGPTTTATLWIPQRTVQNKGVLNKQISGVDPFVVGGASTTAMKRLTVDTSINTDHTITVINSTASEYIVVESAGLTVTNAN